MSNFWGVSASAIILACEGHAVVLVTSVEVPCLNQQKQEGGHVRVLSFQLSSLMHSLVGFFLRYG